MYYAVAMTLTLIMCPKLSTTYSLLDNPNARRFKSFFAAFLALLPLTFLALFRWNTGNDSVYYGGYWDAYQHAKQGINEWDFEPLFYGLTRLCAILKLPFFWYLFVNSLLFMTICCYALYKGSISSGWSVAIFFIMFVYFDSYSALRQSLAAAFSLVAWAKMGADEASRKKDIQILLLFLFASLLHRIALINIPVYLICKFRLPKSNYILFIIFAVLLTPAIQIVLKACMRLIAGGDYEFMGFARVNIITTGIICCLCWVFYDQINAVSKNAYMYLNLAACIFILILNSNAMYLPFRVFDMLKIGYVMIIPYLMRSSKDRFNKLVIGSLIIIGLGACFVNQFFFQEHYVQRYYSVFIAWRVTYFP